MELQRAQASRRTSYASGIAPVHRTWFRPGDSAPPHLLEEQLFEEVVSRCVAAGLVQGEHFSVDGSLIEANASRSSRIPREQLAEAAQVKRTVREYLGELEQENSTYEPVHQQDHISTTDPDAT